VGFIGDRMLRCTQWGATIGATPPRRKPYTQSPPNAIFGRRLDAVIRSKEKRQPGGGVAFIERMWRLAAWMDRAEIRPRP
jgi:hypothetical protein